MSNQSRRPPSYSSTTSSSLAKRHASSSENFGKPMPPCSHMAKKRAPLGNITNHKNVAPSIASRTSLVSSSAALVPCGTKAAKAKGGPGYATTTTGNSSKILPTPLNVNSNPAVPPKAAAILSSDGIIPRIAVSVAVPASSSWDTSPSKTDAMSVSMDETMSSCYSLRSPEIDYVDKTDSASLDSSDRKTFKNLNISDNPETTGNACSRDILIEMKIEHKTVNVDSNCKDPQFCATYACDIYKHLRASEAKKRPAVNYMERVQKDINISMRAILVDWLVEVAEEYRLVPDTLYLTVNYIDRYLSGNAMNRQRLQLLGVACMMIASKYEEICAPQVEEFCYITDNTYFKDEVLQMESSVLNYLKFEMTAPTVKCFLRRFTRAAQGINEVPSLQLECLTNYVAELSLLEYSMLSYAPSLIAASAIFLAKFILYPSKRPWNSTLQHYTLYQPSDLCACVKDLHRLCCGNHSSNLPSVREKYSQHKYKYVAKKHCPPSIPPEYFRN